MTAWGQGNALLAVFWALKATFFNMAAIQDVLAIENYGWGGRHPAIANALDRDKACPFITGAEPYELTMDDLIQTMLVADPNQVEYFIGLVDAYRQSVWNRPFNQEFFAALARGFELWP